MVFAAWNAADRDALDQYGRTVLYLWTESSDFVNFDLIENGFATALRIQPNEAC